MNNKLTIDILAVDPGAVVLRGNALWLYLLLKNPNTPPLGDIQKALASLTIKQRKQVLANAKALGVYSKRVEEALTMIPRQAAA